MHSSCPFVAAAQKGGEEVGQRRTQEEEEEDEKHVTCVRAEKFEGKKG